MKKRNVLLSLTLSVVLTTAALILSEHLSGFKMRIVRDTDPGASTIPSSSRQADGGGRARSLTLRGSTGQRSVWQRSGRAGTSLDALNTSGEPDGVLGWTRPIQLDVNTAPVGDSFGVRPLGRDSSTSPVDNFGHPSAAGAAGRRDSRADDAVTGTEAGAPDAELTTPDALRVTTALIHGVSEKPALLAALASSSQAPPVPPKRILSSSNGDPVPFSTHATISDMYPAIPKDKTVRPKTNPALAKADPALAKADPALAKADPALAQADPANAKADPVLSKADPVLAKADPALAEADPTLAKVDPTNAKADPVFAKADPARAKAHPAHAKADPALAMADPAHAKADPAHAKADPALAIADPAHAKVDPAHAMADPAHAKADPARAQEDPAHAKADPALAKSDPALAMADPAHAKADPALAKADTALPKAYRVFPRPNPVQPKPSPPRSEHRPSPPRAAATVVPPTSRPLICKGCFRSDFAILSDAPDVCSPSPSESLSPSPSQSLSPSPSLLGGAASVYSSFPPPSNTSSFTSSPSSSFPELIILITSSPNGFERRQAIRATWASASRNNTGIVRHVFLLGTAGSDVNTTRDVMAESARHGDVLVADFADSYGNLTYKTMVGLRWLVRHCAHVKFFMKTDQDVYVFVDRVLTLARRHEKTLRRSLGGACADTARPWRDPTTKYYASYRSYPQRLYPGYCSGTGYVSTVKLAEMIVRTSPDIPFFHLEDVYLALVLRHAGAGLTRYPGFLRAGDVCGNPGEARRTLTIHDVSPQTMRAFWESRCGV